MYTVRIPFLVPSTIRIGEQEALIIRAQITFTLKWEGYYHVLSAVGFGSQEEANAFLATTRSAFSWLLLQKGIVSEANLAPQQIQYNTDLIEAGKNLSRSFGDADLGLVDAIIDGSQAAIFETLRNVRKFTCFPPSIKNIVRSDQALSVIIDGASLPQSRHAGENQKLSVALELYGAFFTEQSTKAKYLTLIMSLESLATATSKTPLAIELIEKWAAELEQLKDHLPPLSDDAASLEALQRELLFRREDSVRSQIRKLVFSTLHPDIDASDRARDAVRLYDFRSTLVHEGTVDSQKLATALTEAKALVYRTLRARFTTEAQAPHHRAVS
jgi:hypothetical protein